MPARLLLALALVAGCSQPEVPSRNSPAEPLDLGQSGPGFDVVELVATNTSVGVAPHVGWVRAVNQFGASVPNGDDSVMVDGSATAISFDGHGYGQVVRDTPGVSEVSGAGPSIDLYAFDNAWSGCGLMRAGVAPFDNAVEAAPVTTGALVMADRSLWWVGRDGSSHSVLSADDTLRGLRTAHIDGDGLLDAIAWTSDTVFMLRGRPQAGMSWGGAFRAEGYTVGGADVGDMDDDAWPDLVIAWSSSAKSWLDVWEGDGMWNFEAAPPRLMVDQPGSLGVGDNTGEGRLQATVITSASLWERFVWGRDKRYIPTGPQVDFELSPDTLVRSGLDMNGDGGDELIFQAPFSPSGPRDVFIFDLVEENPLYLKTSPTGAYLTLIDATGNGLGDQLANTNTGALMELSFNGTGYSQREVAQLPEHGPIAMRDYNDDNQPELLLAGDQRWAWYEGGRKKDDNGDKWWQVAEAPTIDPSVALDGPGLVAELNGNPANVELVGFQKDAGETFLKVWSLPQDGTPAVELGSLSVSDTGLEPFDLAICGTSAWALVDGTLWRVNLSSPATPSAAGSLATSGTRVDCGSGPGGASGALLAGSDILMLNDSLGTISTEPSGNAVDVAIGEVAGVGSFGTCTSDGCNVVYWDYGDGGAFASGSDSELSISGDAGDLSLTGAGRVSVADVDGDGNDDLLAFEAEGWISVHRSYGAGIGPAELFHTQRSLSQPASVADVDGDGVMDFVLVDDNGVVLATSCPSE